ncbi:unnamed protein product, partial [Mesorhabditis spiculigera]
VISCRACAAFFRRTAFLKIAYVCQKTKSCDVTDKKQFSCRSCRYQKCLNKGMKPSMIKYTSNELNTKSRAGSSQPSEMSTPPSTPGDPEPRAFEASSSAPIAPDIKLEASETVSDLGEFIQQRDQIKANVEALFESNTKLTNFLFPIKLSLTQQAMISLSEHMKKWPMCTPDKVYPGKPFTIDEVVVYYHQEIENIAKFCMSFENFAGLESGQKWILFRRFWSHFQRLERYRAILRCFGKSPITRVLIYNGAYYDFEEHLEWTTRSTHLKQIVEYGGRSIMKEMILVGGQLHRLEPTEFELVFCMLQIMWSTKNTADLNEHTTTVAAEARHKLSQEVHEYYTVEMNKPSYAGRLMQIMNIVSALEEVDRLHREDRTAFRTFELVPPDLMNNHFTEF